MSLAFEISEDQLNFVTGLDSPSTLNNCEGGGGGGDILKLWLIDPVGMNKSSRELGSFNWSWIFWPLIGLKSQEI